MPPSNFYTKFHKYRNKNMNPLVIINLNQVCTYMGAISTSEPMKLILITNVDIPNNLSYAQFSWG